MKIKTFHRAITLLSLVCGLIPFGLQAQIKSQDSTISRFYLKASAGYGIGINGGFIQNDDNNGNNTNIESKLGNGLYGLANAGYQYSPDLSAELGLGYLYGFTDYSIPNVDGNFRRDHGNMLQIIPSIVFSTSFGNFKPYLKVGLVVGLPTAFAEYKETDSSYATPQVTDSKGRFFGGLATGLQTSIGCSYALNNKLSLFAEVCLNDVGFQEQRQEIYYETINGVDQLPSLPASQKEYVYKKTGPIFYFPGSSDQATEVVQDKIPFSGMYLNVGLKLNLGSSVISPDIETNLEHRYYTRLTIGYGFASNGDLYYDVIQGPMDSDYAVAKLYSSGAGLNIGVGGGYMLTPNLGFDLGFNYVAGKEIKSAGLGFIRPYSSSSSIYETSQTGNMPQINPSVFFTTNIGYFKPYARLGLLIGFGTIYSSNVFSDTISSSNINFSSKWKYYGGVSVGYNTAIGIAYPLNRRFDIYTEACFNTIYDVPTNGTLLSETLNGVNEMNYLTSAQKRVIFKTSYNDSVNNDPNKTQTESAIAYSFSALVINIGIRMWL